ncbi:hypothetical protein LJR231_002696 [Phyllobacterium sp. LjRoot231]|uniref:argonaute/piwi family protein n=1 Tax=Phyllobacterium sp. LjRoot231 TaxID=3342289 RepID=UPI003ECEF0F4
MSESNKVVRLGVVGSADAIGKFREWVIQCQNGVPAKNSRQPNLFPSFPGLSSGGAFRTSFIIEDRDVGILSRSTLSTITSEIDDETAIALAVEAYVSEVRSLAEQDRPPQVIVCALPVEVIERVSSLRATLDDPDTEEDTFETSRYVDRAQSNFRGSLKAGTLNLRIPIQLVWPTTYDNNAVVRRKLATLSTRKVQDEATRAWNFFCALYYKAGGTPWRMIREKSDISTTFLGISFFKNIDGSALKTSSAQLFDERGEGLILKGGLALEDKTDRQPYLSADDAFSLTTKALKTYKKEHLHYPGRLVIHKSSKFHPEEMDGFSKAVEAAELEIADFLWLPVKLFRNGIYPPLRGTAMRLDEDKSILYTRGSVDFFATYPGLYVPNPLFIIAQRRDTPSWDVLLREMLALTKMNWNGTQFDGALPVTLRAAKQVGEILKYVADETTPDPRYRFYM